MTERKWRVARVEPSVWDTHPDLPWRVFGPDGRVHLYAASFEAVARFYAPARTVSALDVAVAV